MRRTLAALPSGALVVLVAGCGGGAAEAPPKSTTPAAESADAGGGDVADLETRKKAFVADCSKEEPGTEAYCGCAWDVARATYGDDAVRAPGTPTRDDLAKIHVKVAGACAAHFPPEVIERAFMAGCTKKQPELRQYCACSWAELAGKMSPGELVIERAKGTERYQAAVQRAANACSRLRPAR